MTSVIDTKQKDSRSKSLSEAFVNSFYSSLYIIGFSSGPSSNSRIILGKKMEGVGFSPT